MTEILPPHQLIASDSYWGAANDLPGIAVKDKYLDEISSVHFFSQSGVAKVQSLYRKAVVQHLPLAIEIGEELPLLERGEGLIRVVEDVRELYANSPKKRLSREKQLLEHFDFLADKMIEESLYSGDIARTIVQQDDRRYARIFRIVSYLTGSKSGTQLEGIPSPFLLGPSNGFNLVMPPVKVGESYRRNKAGTIVSKIALAELLVPVRAKRKEPKRVFFVVKPSFSLSV